MHDDLQYLLARLDRSFALRPVMPRPALIYRLAEVGPRRFDERWLAKALDDLSRHGELPESAPFLHTAPPSEREADAPTALDIDRVLSTVAALAATDVDMVTRSLVAVGVDVLEMAVGGTTAPARVNQVAPATLLAGPCALPRTDAVALHRSGRGTPILLWVTHELPWLAPDDLRLLERLEEANSEDARLVIVTRKSAPALFPVLKAIGGAAVQLSWFLSTSASLDGLSERADEAGWPPVRGHLDTAEHGAWSQLANWVARTADQAPRITLAQRNALDSLRAVAGSAGGRLTPVALLDWADEANLDVSSAWRDTIAAWAAIEGGVLPPAPTPARDQERAAGGGQPRGRSRSKPTAPTDDDAPRTTEITRFGVAAEVDRDTWDALRRRVDEAHSTPRTAPGPAEEPATGAGAANSRPRAGLTPGDGPAGDDTT